MPPPQTCCIDTSSLLVWCVDTYPPATFPGLQSRIEQLIAAGRLRSPKAVQDEIKHGDDCHAWCNAQTELFVEESAALQRIVRSLMATHQNPAKPLSSSKEERDVQAWYCVLLIAEGRAQPPHDLAPDTRLVSVACQAVMAVDDVITRTSADGWVFAQAKRRVNLSTAATSSLASSLDQFVRQYKACQEASTEAQPARPLDHTRDRLVLAFRPASSSDVTTNPRDLLRSVRHGVAPTLHVAAHSAAETEVATAVKACLEQSWNAAYGRAPTAEELWDVLMLMYVQRFDIEAGQADERRALDVLRVVLAVPDDASAAWAKLLELCAQMRSDRSAANFNALVRALRQAGIALNAPPDYRADIAALKSWTECSLGAASAMLLLRRLGRC